jgi:RluA family pseudouridine synthase
VTGVQTCALPIYTHPMLTYRISALDHIRRIESFLQNLMPAAPPSYIRKLIKGGNVIVNEQICTFGSILFLSDTVSLKETARTGALLTNRCSAPDILYEDDHIVIFNKPAGIPIHRSAEQGGENLMELASLFLQSRDNLEIKLRPVNRLDKGTSGAVIAAKNSASAGAFGKLFQENLVEKRYLTLVTGKTREEGLIDFPLDGRETVTSFRTLYQGTEAALLAVYPLTGRTHQIRRHLSAINHPLIGDTRYGGRKLKGFNNEALHAFKISFRDPFSLQDMEFFAPLAERFLQNMSILAGETFPSLMNTLKDL